MKFLSKYKKRYIKTIVKQAFTNEKLNIKPIQKLVQIGHNPKGLIIGYLEPTLNESQSMPSFVAP